MSAVSLRNALSVLQHYFALYAWNVNSLASKRVVLMCKSAKNNLPLKPKVKCNFTVDMLQRLVYLYSDLPNAHTFKALFPFAFHGFFRLAELSMQLDIIWLKILFAPPPPPPRVSSISKNQHKICNHLLNIDLFICHTCRIQSYAQCWQFKPR